jgi:hypothetical protein
VPLLAVYTPRTHQQAQRPAWEVDELLEQGRLEFTTDDSLTPSTVSYRLI